MLKSLMTAALRCVPATLLTLVLSMSLLSSDPVLGQAASSGSGAGGMLQLFQSLTPDQQDAIMKQFGAGGGSVGALGDLLGGAGPSSGASSGAQKLSREGKLNRQTEAAQQAMRTGEDEEAALPGLKGQDWVIIEVDVPLQARPAAAPQPAPVPAMPAAAAGASGGLASLLAASAAAQATAPPAAPATPAEPDENAKRLQPLVDLIRSRNPYQLSRDGELTLPGFAPIALLGLSDQQATLRLQIEPGLRGLTIRLTQLPLRKTGVDALKPFGYDVFNQDTPSTFAPNADLPVPLDYVVGSGDELTVQLYGAQNRSLRLSVGRDGNVNLPDIGPMTVAGQRFTAVKASIEARVERQMIGVHATVSMGDTRAIRVMVLGAARVPGSYTVSSLTTITASLFAAGGVRPSGSLRNIQLRRRGALVRELDLYDLLIRGDSSGDEKLQQGDVVFIPPLGPTASINGEVRRPAIYELKGESTVAGLVQLAGGLTAEADASRAMLTGFDEAHHRIVMAVDPGSSTQRLHNGDLLSVARTRPTLDEGIQLQGYVFSPGAYAWRQGMRLSALVHSVDDLRPNADLHYVLIRREQPPDRHVTVLSADLAAALAAPGSAADVPLMSRDRVTVFDLASGRDHVIEPMLDELRLEANADQPSQVVSVSGRVRVPGSYPLEPGMTVRDLVRAGGGTEDEAFSGSAELIRYHVIPGGARSTELVNVDLGAALRGEPGSNLRLQPFDSLTVKEVPEWSDQEAVTLKGEVRFPGSYMIRRGETLKSLLARAGGLTPYAFPEGSIFTREELREREQEQLDVLGDRMQRDVALLALQAAGAGQPGAASALSVGQSLLGQLKTYKAVGRMVIDLPRLENAPSGSTYDVVLRGGDNLIVPRFQQQVTVIGEVQNTTSHLYHPQLSRDDYIAMSGGITHRADRGKIYIVRASGSVVASENSGWFRRGGSVPIKPGDTIVVPLDTEHIPALPLWTQVSQILYNLAVAVLAIHSA